MRILLPMSVVAFGACYSIAAPIGIDDFSGSATLINYDNLNDGTVITDQYADLGVMFRVENGMVDADAVRGGFFENGSAPNAAFTEINLQLGGYLEISFSQPMLRFGTQFITSLNESIIVEAFGQSGLLETVEVTGLRNDIQSDVLEGFIGIENNFGISSVRLRSSTLGFNFTIDDTRFEIPSPSGVALLGLYGLAATRRRR